MTNVKISDGTGFRRLVTQRHVMPELESSEHVPPGYGMQLALG